MTHAIEEHHELAAILESNARSPGPRPVASASFGGPVT
jgi:hypothetical protein